MRKTLNRYLFFLTALITVAAVLDQLRRPPGERPWHGTVFGLIPYDFRPPSLERFKAAWWSPDDPRIFTPRDLGVGWAVNLPRLLELVGNAVRRNRAE